MLASPATGSKRAGFSEGSCFSPGGAYTQSKYRQQVQINRDIQHADDA